MNKNQKFVKVGNDYVPEIYLSASDRDKLKSEFGRLPRGLPSATSGVPVVDFIENTNYEYAITFDGDGQHSARDANKMIK